MKKKSENYFLISRFHNRAGYTIEEWCDRRETEGDIYHIFIYHSNKDCFKWGVYSGFKDDKIVGQCIGLFDDIVKNIKNKTARRYFLRKARKLEMHDGLLLQDFLNSCGDRLDWNKIKSYEREQLKNGNLYSKEEIFQYTTNRREK